MKVYVVISNGEAVKGAVEGVFVEKPNARKCFRGIVKDWKQWSKGDDVEIEKHTDYFSLVNYDKDETVEVFIVEKELQ